MIDQEDQPQYGRDLLEQTERFVEAQERAELAAWNALKSLNDLNELEADYATKFSNGLREVIAAIDKARAELGGGK